MRLLKQLGERLDRARIAASAEHVDRGESAEEIAGFSRGDERLDRGAAADAPERLERAHRDVVVDVASELNERRHGSRVAAAAEYLHDIGDDGRIRVRDETGDRLLDGALACDERVDGGRESRLTVSGLLEDQAKGIDGGTVQSRERLNHFATNHPTRIDEHLRKLGDARGAA